MKINLQINKMMIKMNKQRYFDVSFWYSRASWGVLGVSWGNKTDPTDGAQHLSMIMCTYKIWLNSVHSFSNY